MFFNCYRPELIEDLCQSGMGNNIVPRQNYSKLWLSFHCSIQRFKEAFARSFAFLPIFVFSNLLGFYGDDELLVKKYILKVNICVNKFGVF